MILFCFIFPCPAVDSVGQDWETLLQHCHPNTEAGMQLGTILVCYSVLQPKVTNRIVEAWVFLWKLSASSKPLSKCAGCPETQPSLAKSWVEVVCLFEVAHWHWSEQPASCSQPSSTRVSLINCLAPPWTWHSDAAAWFCAARADVVIFAGVMMHCVKDEHTAINMNLHYLENGCVMVNFIFHKELFFLPLGFALKVSSECLCFL